MQKRLYVFKIIKGKIINSIDILNIYSFCLYNINTYKTIDITKQVKNVIASLNSIS